MADIRRGLGAAPPPGRRDEVFFALAVLLSVILAAVVLEAAYRAKYTETISTRVDWSAMIDAVGHHDAQAGSPRFRPNSDHGQMQFNRFGLRGPDVPTPAPPDLVRIAFLGDSKVMSANYAEEQSLPAQTVARLADRVPACRFDYVSISGPGYEVPFLARLWTEIAPQVQPAMAVLMAGSPADMVQTARTLPDRIGLPVEQDAVGVFLDRSFLLRAVERNLAYVAAWVTRSPIQVTAADVLEQRHRMLFDPLLDAVRETPVLALGYRSGQSRGAALDQQVRLSDPLPAGTPGMTGPKTQLISEWNVAALRAFAAEAGWRFADPVARLATQKGVFLDKVHFSQRGLSLLGDAIAAEIALLITADCRIRKSSDLFDEPRLPLPIQPARQSFSDPG